MSVMPQSQPAITATAITNVLMALGRFMAIMWKNPLISVSGEPMT